MSDRVRELAEREAELQLRCAVQRRAFAHEVSSIETRLRSVDRVAAVTRSVVFHPVVIAAGVVAVLAFGRARMFQSIARGLVLASAGRRLFRAAKGK